MGGGSTGLEALRLGCEAHGVELNPVAYLIELCTLVYPQKYGEKLAEDVAHWANRLHELTRTEYSQYYSDELEAIIWVRTATCPNVSCALEIPLANQWWIEKNTRSKVAIVPFQKPWDRSRV